MIGSILRIRYEVTGLVSEGPIFCAYTARDRLLARDVTVRVLQTPFDKEGPFHAALEACILKMKPVHHPNIEVMQNMDDHEGLPFLVSEASKGYALTDRIRKLAPFTTPVAIGIVVSILEGLEALHANGLAHGDVAPHNLVLQNEGTVRIQLPGIWESYRASATAGTVVFRDMAPYLAPEIMTGASPTAVSDVYSAGILFFELLTGRLPFTAENDSLLATAKVNQSVPSVRSLNASIPQVVDNVISKAVAHDPAQRYKRASEMLSDLRVIQDALRFGKSLSWPLGENKAVTKGTQVAPKMSAIRTEAKPKPSKPDKRKSFDDDDRGEAERYERIPPDVPWWIRIPLALSFFAFAGCVGAFVFYNLNRPKLARVPNVKNLTLVEAINAFSAAKLKQGTVYRVASEQVPKDRIVDQIPRGSEQVREGSAVTVRISAGSKLVLVPDLLGHTMDEARSMLEELDLVLDDKIEDAPSSKIERGKVIGQKPERRAQAERGQRIRIILSSGPASGDVAPQDRSTEEVAPATDKPAGPVGDGSAESSIYNIKLQLTDLKRKAEVKIEMTDDYGTLTVYDESHEPNDIISLKREGHGAQATFRVYYDDELVLTKTQKAKKAKP